MIIIPIGLQCTNATFKKNINKISHTFPFDWMFATPKFVFEMLILLLKENMDIKQLVTEHFFLCEKRASYHKIEHYYTCENGFALYNCKYDAIFPHDENSIDSVNKYIRRFERLKDLILTTEEKLYFIYTSQSSLENGNFTIDGNNIINNEYLYLSKIYELIGKFRKNYKVIVFDSIKEDKKLLNEYLYLSKMHELIKECIINYKVTIFDLEKKEDKKLLNEYLYLSKIYKFINKYNKKYNLITINSMKIEDKKLLNNLLSKIYKLIEKYRKKYKVTVFDRIHKKDEGLLNENIIFCELNKCDNWSELLPQMNNYMNLFEK